MLRLLAPVARVLPRGVPATAHVRPLSTTSVRTSFWDTVLPLIQGNRRERQLQRKQGGLLPEDYERVQRDQRRDEMMASQSSTGDMLMEDSYDAPEFQAEERQRQASDAKRQKRLLRKRWGGLTEPNGVE